MRRGKNVIIVVILLFRCTFFFIIQSIRTVQYTYIIIHHTRLVPTENRFPSYKKVGSVEKNSIQIYCGVKYIFVEFININSNEITRPVYFVLGRVFIVYRIYNIKLKLHECTLLVYMFYYIWL